MSASRTPYGNTPVQGPCPGQGVLYTPPGEDSRKSGSYGTARTRWLRLPQRPGPTVTRTVTHSLTLLAIDSTGGAAGVHRTATLERSPRRQSPCRRRADRRFPCPFSAWTSVANWRRTCRSERRGRTAGFRARKCAHNGTSGARREAVGTDDGSTESVVGSAFVLSSLGGRSDYGNAAQPRCPD
jgi:hypothetical protein